MCNFSEVNEEEDPNKSLPASMNLYNSTENLLIQSIFYFRFILNLMHWHTLGGHDLLFAS